MSLRELSYAEAIREALAIALESDERVFLMEKTSASTAALSR